MKMRDLPRRTILRAVTIVVIAFTEAKSIGEAQALIERDCGDDQQLLMACAAVITAANNQRGAK